MDAVRTPFGKQGGSFKDTHPQDLDGVAETACIRRLVTGEEDCPHSALKADPDPTGPPHKPPAADHATLWLDDGDPAVYGMHVYPGNIERLDDIPPAIASVDGDHGRFATAERQGIIRRRDGYVQLRCDPWASLGD